MTNRVSITNKEEFESAISTQKEIGREQYHNYLKSQKMFIDYIEKQAILDFLKERVDVRSKHQYDKNSSYYYSNEAAINAFDSIIKLIEQGRFDATM